MTLARDGTEGLQDRAERAVINIESIAGLWDHEEGGTPELRRMHFKTNRWKINCDCGNSAYLCDRFDGSGVVEVLLKSRATDCVRDHHLLMVVPPRTRVASSAWVATSTIGSPRRLAPKATVPNGAFNRTMNHRYVALYIQGN